MAKKPKTKRGRSGDKIKITLPEEEAIKAFLETPPETLNGASNKKQKRHDA